MGKTEQVHFGVNAVAELNQKVLFTACRAIYDLAGANYVLPPLIRDAGSPETQQSYKYNCHLGENELCFSVALDETYANRNALVHSRLPLKFHLELREAQFPHDAIELSDADGYELIRAFFLGVKLPIVATKTGEHAPYKLSVQLSSTFFVDCGELGEECRDWLPKLICDDVGQKIFARASEFFLSRQQGVAACSLRAAQSLFGEARPPAEALWPAVLEATDVALCPAPANGNAPAVPRRPRHAVAATILFGAMVASCLATGLFWRGAGLVPAETAADPPAIELAAAQPEPAFLPPRGTAANRIDAAQPSDAPAPASAAASAASREPAPLAEAKPKPAPDAQAESGDRPRPPRRPAMRRPSLSAKALAFTRGAVASLSGFARVIGRIPGEIIKPHRHI